MAIQHYNPHSSRTLRAQQAWNILVGAAHRGELVTYDELALTMFEKTAAGVLAGILGCIAFWCQDNGLPALTSIVINSDTGEPGLGIPVGGSIPAEQRKAHVYKWHLIHPPTLKDLEEIEAKYL